MLIIKKKIINFYCADINWSNFQVALLKVVNEEYL